MADELLTKQEKAQALKSIKALKGHIEEDEPIYLVIETVAPTWKARQYIPRIVPVKHAIGRAGEKRIMLVTKDGESVKCREALNVEESPTEEMFAEITTLKKFRAKVANRKHCIKMLHDIDVIVVNEVLQKRMVDIVSDSMLSKRSKLPYLVQMAPRTSDKFVDPAYIAKQVRMICKGTSFVPVPGDSLSVIVGRTPMEADEIVENIVSVLYYLTDDKFKPVGGVLKVASIKQMTLKTAQSISLPVRKLS